MLLHSMYSDIEETDYVLLRIPTFLIDITPVFNASLHF